MLSPPIPERDVDPTSFTTLTPESSPLKPSQSPVDEGDLSRSQLPRHLANNHVPFDASSGKPHPLLSSLPNTPLTRTVIEDYLLPKALTPTMVRSPLNLMPEITGVGHWLSEVIYIMRPLLYVLMLRPTAMNFIRGSTSINYNSRPALHMLQTPLAVSLLLSFLARHLRPQTPISSSSSYMLERQEYARRDRELLWALFRGELWTEWTRPKLESMRRGMEGKSLFGLLAGVIQDWVPLVDEYYYCEHSRLACRLLLTRMTDTAT